MQFEEIRLKHFQQFADELTIGNLQPDLNVICGSNESGKSTLIAAIKAAIFERYSSRPSQERYRPFAMQVSPAVGLRFRYQGCSYDLAKVFSNKKDGGVELTDLSGRGKWIDHEAEERVAAMFGNEMVSRGESKPGSQGIHGLLWVDQTHAHAKVVPADRAHSSLQGALDEEVLEMLGGERGQALLQRVKALRDEYLTANGKPKGEYKKRTEELDKLTNSCAELGAELKNYESRVDELGLAEQRLAQYRQDASLQTVEAAIAQLEKQWRTIEELKRKISQHESKLALAQVQRNNTDEKNLARKQRIAALVAAEHTLAGARDRLAETEAQVAPLTAEASALESHLQHTRQEAKQLAAQIGLIEAARQFKRLGEELKAVDGQYRQAQKLQSQIDDYSARARHIVVDKEQVDELGKLATGIHVNELQLNAVATQIELDLLSQQTVDIGGQTLSGKQSVLITEATAMQLPGLGSCVIQPGGGEIKAIRRQLHEQRELLAAALQRADVDCVDAANHALNERQGLLAEKTAAEKTLAALAPAGMAALEIQLTNLRVEFEGMQQKLAGSDATNDADATQLSQQHARHESLASSAEERLGSLRLKLQEASNAQIKAQVMVDNDKAALLAIQDLLKREREQAGDADLHQQWRDAVAEVAVLETELCKFVAELAVATPGDIEAELNRQRQAYTAITADIDRLSNKASELRGELRSLGLRGLADQLAETELARAQQALEFRQLQRKVFGLDLLYRSLEQASERARKSVAQPIVAAMQAYLPTLMPGAAPVIDENFQLMALAREDSVEPFERLSIGTREQLAVLVRLAYADMLVAKGQPVTVLLDDALVNADDQRRDRMKSILYRAARNYQIILFTCQPRHYQDAGGHMLYID